MGSFNVAGTMSKLSISPGDKVVFFILTPTHNESIPIKGANLVSNDGASIFFSPRFLPIVGIYNDYGGIANIEWDENVQYIEEYFGGISIDEIVRQTSLNKWGSIETQCTDDAKSEELWSFVGMFELHSVYQDMVAFNKQQDNALKRMSLSQDILELMGFKFVSQNTGDIRFKWYFVHSDIKDYAMFCDGNCSILSHLGSGKFERLYSAQQVIDFFPHVKFSGVDKLEQKCIHSFNVERAIFAMLEIQKLEAKHGIEAWLHIRKKPEDYCYHLRLWKQMIYIIERVANDQFGLEEAFIDLLNFDRAMSSTNSFYYPAANGEQFGNYPASKALCESSLCFVNDKIAKAVNDDDLEF